MENIEEAYEYLSRYALSFVENRCWDEIYCKFQIYSTMVTAEQYYIFNLEKNNKGGFSIDSSAMWDGLDAASYIRDNILENTGDRIWGLIFTLYPSGKFTIEYDYNIPEDYEESDKTISGEEINKSLMELNNKINGKI
jgi:hypothetical protein